MICNNYSEYVGMYGGRGGGGGNGRRIPEIFLRYFVGWQSKVCQCTALREGSEREREGGGGGGGEEEVVQKYTALRCVMSARHSRGH